MRGLENLNQCEVELAFQLLDHLWEKQGEFLHVKEIPQCLQHLEEEEWQVLGAALESLYEQREQSSLH